ncbi:MAG: ankyrin repeat domain-containing protein [Chloroflexi bacterium]|nr:ankyrin repeat domain-containing protein [Chloroflexota bacterium]
MDRDAYSGSGARQQSGDRRISPGAGRPARYLYRRRAGPRRGCARLPGGGPRPVRGSGAHNLGVLFFPALAGNIEIAEILHAAGAAINPELGQSPLIGAILGGHVRMARWLLDRDADAYATDFEGHTTLDLARKHEQQEMIDLLLPFFPDEVDAEP